VLGRAKSTSTKRNMGLSAREPGLKAVKTRKTWPNFLLSHDQQILRTPSPFLPLSSAPETPPSMVERWFMAGCLVSLVLGLEWAIAEAHPMHASGISALSVLLSRTAHATAARACRGRCSTPSEPILALQSPLNSPRLRRSQVRRGHRAQGPPAQARPARATLVAHSPCHRSSRFTGRCSSPSRSSCIRQSPPSCPLARRCQAR